MITIETVEHTEYLPPNGDRHDFLMYSLSIDNHSILGNKYFSDLQWICKLKEGLEYYFPHIINLKAGEISNHPDKAVLAAYLKHQYEYNKGFKYGDPLCDSFFDEAYNPSQHFNYSIPQEAITV
jgi:hypothetical protein